MKQLRLKKKHFSTLDTDSFDFIRQYQSNMNCPIAKALKEKFKTESVSVNPFDASVDGEKVYSSQFRYRNVEEAAKKLAAGAKYVALTIENSEI